MANINRYKKNQNKRKIRVSRKIKSVSLLPRLLVFRSNKYLFAQIVKSDGTSHFGTRGKNPSEVGEKIAKKALDSGISKVSFDRGGYKYHGKVKQIAESARSAGLVI